MYTGVRVSPQKSIGAENTKKRARTIETDVNTNTLHSRELDI